MSSKMTCHYQGCLYEADTLHLINRHERDRHGQLYRMRVGGEVFQIHRVPENDKVFCPVAQCSYGSQTSSGLRKHIKHSHEQGDTGSMQVDSEAPAGLKRLADGDGDVEEHPLKKAKGKGTTGRLTCYAGVGPEDDLMSFCNCCRTFPCQPCCRQPMSGGGSK